MQFTDFKIDTSSKYAIMVHEGTLNSESSGTDLAIVQQEAIGVMDLYLCFQKIVDYLHGYSEALKRLVLSHTNSFLKVKVILKCFLEVARMVQDMKEANCDKGGSSQGKKKTGQKRAHIISPVCILCSVRGRSSPRNFR